MIDVLISQIGAEYVLRDWLQDLIGVNIRFISCRVRGRFLHMYKHVYESVERLMMLGSEDG